MASGDLTFVLPLAHNAISGGNIYNAELMRALGPLVPVRTTTVEQLGTLVESEAPGVYFVDSLNLRQARIVSRRTGRQYFVLIVHHLPSWEPDIDPGDERIRWEETVLPLFDGFLSTSPFTTGQLVARGYGSERIMTVNPALPQNELPVRAYQRRLRAVLVGNLIPGKSVREFLGALTQRVRGNDDFRFDIIGRTDVDAGYAQDCIQLVTASEILRRSVRIHGQVQHERVDEFYRMAGLFVSASRFETFGMALQEARAHGLPIVACDGGNTRNHFTHGENGLLFESVSALADGFLELVRDPRQMRALFGRSQRLRPNNDYTWSAAAARLLEQIDQCLEPRVRKPGPSST